MKRHTGPHKYLRTKVKFPKPHYIYQCVISGCEHYIQDYRIIGKLNQCWVCANTHTIDKADKKKPICGDCWNTAYGKKQKGNEVAENILRDIGVIN